MRDTDLRRLLPGGSKDEWCDPDLLEDVFRFDKLEAASCELVDRWKLRGRWCEPGRALGGRVLPPLPPLALLMWPALRLVARERVSRAPSPPVIWRLFIRVLGSLHRSIHALWMPRAVDTSRRTCLIWSPTVIISVGSVKYCAVYSASLSRRASKYFACAPVKADSESS